MRACWLKWVGRDWSISADYIWLNYSGANNSGVPTSRGKIVAVVIGIIGTVHHGNKLSVVRINNCMSKSHRLTHHPVALPLDLDHIQQEVAICMAMKGE